MGAIGLDVIQIMYTIIILKMTKKISQKKKIDKILSILSNTLYNSYQLVPFKQIKQFIKKSYVTKVIYR